MSSERPRRPITLFRCAMPSDWLCPCGTVARRLRRLGVDHETIRVSQRRSQRPEIEELTDQRRVPVLVDGDQVITDSKRIIEYLEWRSGESGARADGPEGSG